MDGQLRPLPGRLPHRLDRIAPHKLRRMNPRLLIAASLAAVLSACVTAPRDSAPANAAVPAPPEPVTVVESYTSAESPADELDSLATWPTEDGKTWLIATAKSGHRLVVYDADTGEQLRTFGGEGQQPGQFKRPNGVAVHGDYLVVVERDNHRVQVLTLPGFKYVGTFGDKELRSPYGIWLTEKEPGELEAYITDSFMYGKHFDEVPPFKELDQRVRSYRVS